ncbi:hypothetical protein VSR68_40515 [Paraburkholderia phymatum]|uniref:hypothetical protein n=1 Tax=Paraburkholderia phymatum TaxID=148447 RepID=UPI0031700AE2
MPKMAADLLQGKTGRDKMTGTGMTQAMRAVTRTVSTQQVQAALRSGDICYGLHAIASNARCNLLPVIASPNSLKLRLPHPERQLAGAGIALFSLT